MSSGTSDAGGGTAGFKPPGTRMTTAYGRVTKALAKTAPDKLGKARQARQQINRAFRVPTRKGAHGH